jgi:hypothetical protein
LDLKLCVELKDDFLYLKLDDLAVKGKTVGLEIYTVIIRCGSKDANT